MCATLVLVLPDPGASLVDPELKQQVEWVLGNGVRKCGLEMMSNLYGKMSGLAYPLYVFNAPGGKCGHVLLGASWVRSLGPGEYILRTPDGGEVRYSEPAELVSQPVVRDR